MTTDLTNISFTLSPAILLKAYTYKYVTMQSIEILLKKYTGQKNLVEPSPWQPPPLVLVQKDGLPPLPHLQFVWSLFGLKNCRLFKRVFLSPAPSATRPSNCFTASGTSGSCKKSMNIGLDLSKRLQTRPGRLEVVQWPTAGSCLYKKSVNNEESLKKCLLIGNHTCKLLYQRGGWQENLLHWSVRVWVGLGSVQEEAVDCPTNPTDSVWWCWCKDFFVTCVLFGVYTRVRNINQSQKGNLSDGWLGLWWVSFWKYVFVWHFLKS